MTVFDLGLLGATAFVISWFITFVLSRLMPRLGFVDVPNQRSSHCVPKPRGGGAAILAGLAMALPVVGASGVDPLSATIIVATALVALVGLIDDRFALSPFARLAVHVAAAVAVVSVHGPLERFPFPPPADWLLSDSTGNVVSVVWIVALTNIYNFLDGIDGLAAAQGVVGGLTVGIGVSALAPVGFALAGACAGFLLWNWHPARIFMGDVGSGALGFLFAAAPFAIQSPMKESAAVLVLAALWLFVFDGTFTIVRRVVHGERLWLAHRTHLYQRLTATGLRHDQVVLRSALFMIVVPAITLATYGWSDWLSPWAAMVVSVFLAVVYWRWTVFREHQIAR